MEFETKHLAELKKTYYSGVLSVELNGRKTTFHSKTELKEIIVELEKKLTPESKRAPRFVCPSFDKGYQ